MESRNRTDDASGWPRKRATTAPPSTRVPDPCEVCGKPMVRLAEPIMTRAGKVEWQHTGDRRWCQTRKGTPAVPHRTAKVGTRLNADDVWSALAKDPATGRDIDSGAMLDALMALGEDTDPLIVRATALIFTAVRNSDLPFSVMKLGNLAPLEPNMSRGKWLELRACVQRMPEGSRRKLTTAIRDPDWWSKAAPVPVDDATREQRAAALTESRELMMQLNPAMRPTLRKASKASGGETRRARVSRERQAAMDRDTERRAHLDAIQAKINANREVVPYL